MVKLAWNSFMNTVRHVEKRSMLIMPYLSTLQKKGKRGIYFQITIWLGFE